MILKRVIFLTSFISFASIPFAFSQSFNGQSVITTAVPFLTITPDSRSGALGDAGVAISPDANSMYWNSSKLAFSEKRAGFSASYNPWLRNIINDMALMYLSGYGKIGDNQAIGGSLTYFDLGNIEFTNDIGSPIGNFVPREVALTVGYARKLGDKFSMGINLRYINSNLTGYNDFNHLGATPGSTAAGDVTAYYTNDVNWGGKDVNVSFGGAISNLGGKIGYNSAQKDFIPTNLKIGTAITYHMDVYNKLTFALDLNKLMVPTPDLDTLTDDNGVKYYGNKNANKGFLPGVFGSFSDAPGGFKEEMQEISLSTGLEYWYNDFFAARIGYFGENKNKGNRKYFTAGIGFRYMSLGFDFAYLFPQGQNSPLANTLRFTLHVNIDKSKKPSPEDITN